ncbi:Ceramide very long chain fatty acid hydroxylase SCS7 [Rhodotorula toruloides]|uniref:Ceramide very long chain fatty acid hydroxylase n=1 Tax=Rhodotorula toruloides TaxID=5286 RepID=A0A0K3CMC0_RHOTO|nr:Ceramide very long chain fatty acid hydroxylase SCS7 [Rhodotorula toruloides]PRQ72325.1 inositolphosphorylceramide-B C-26 hydroxylase [Rhodotorula toruloides]
MATAADRATKRTRIYLRSEVEKHNTAKDCWVVHNNRVYDVSQFLEDHPGGDDLILNWAGKDITEVMQDPIEHSHSDSAYQVLDEYQIGRLGQEECITNPDFEFTDDWHPDDTDNVKDWERNQFLDLNRPLIMQVWNSDFSKAFYLQQVHQPRHLPRPARLFGPWYLEIFTMTSWYVVPLIWLPVAGYLLRQSIIQQTAAGLSTSTALSRSGACFLVGNVIWTFLEYTMHRFLFHIDEHLPDRPFFLMLHFLLHGIHHYIPMDRMRLVMPPLLFFALQTPFTKLAHKLFPAWMANGIISGAFVFYVAYDVMHYALHHTKLPEYVRKQKSYHMEHHYKEPELGFGVTSPFWDRVFGTTFVSRPKDAPPKLSAKA